MNDETTPATGNAAGAGTPVHAPARDVATGSAAHPPVDHRPSERVVAWPIELENAPNRQEAIRAWWLSHQDTWAEARDFERREELSRSTEQRSLDVAGLMHDRNGWDWHHACRDAERAGLPPPPKPLRVRETIPPDPAPAVRALQAWADACGVDLVFVGAVAVGVLVRPRYTRDVDALANVSGDRLDAALSRLGEFGLQTRAGWTPEFGRRRALVLLYHPGADMGVDVRLAISPLHAGFVAAGSRVPAFGTRISVPAIEDLFVMKALASRMQDRQDMQNILDFRPDAVDLARVRRIVAEVASATATPTLLEEYDSFIRSHFNHLSRRHLRKPWDP